MHNRTHEILIVQAHGPPEKWHRVDSDDASSPTSYGAHVTSSKEKKLPDFIVVRATDNKNNDKIILIIEVKKRKKLSKDERQREQLKRYLEAAGKRPGGKDPNLRGMLIRHSIFDVFRLNDDGRAVMIACDQELCSPECDSLLQSIANGNPIDL